MKPEAGSALEQALGSDFALGVQPDQFAALQGGLLRLTEAAPTLKEAAENMIQHITLASAKQQPMMLRIWRKVAFNEKREATVVDCDSQTLLVLIGGLILGNDMRTAVALIDALFKHGVRPKVTRADAKFTIEICGESVVFGLLGKVI